jgi:hypothetical protein
MRALAEFIMRGRLQAGAVAVFGYIVPLLAPAAVALVTLRKGAFEGTIILLLGLTPAFLSLLFGEAGSVVVWITLLTLLLVYVPALVLRATISLPMAIASSIAVSVVITLAILWWVPDAVQTLIDSLVNQLAVTESEQQSGGSAIGSQSGISGVIAYVLAFNGITGVLIGRWLQSVAYNPGGFGTEFRELRLGLVYSAICFVLSIWLRYLGDEYWWWSNVFAIPLLLVAVAIAHHVAKARALATAWLVLFYFAVFLFMPIVICIGFVDTWVNFRNRLQNKQ